MKLLHKFSILLIFSLVLNQAIASPERGRLPDGRAFRKDVHGNQIIDYIAELELNVEALMRRVSGLEDELAERNKTLAQLKAEGVEVSKDLAERDLLASPTEASETINSNTDKELDKIGELKAALASSKECCAEKEVALTKVTAAKAEAKRLKEALKETSDLKQKLALNNQKKESVFSKEKTQLSHEMQALKDQLKQQTKAYKALKTEHTTLLANHKELKKQKLVQTSLAPRASLKRTDISRKRSEALNFDATKFKEKLKEELLDLEVLLAKRNRLFKAHNSKPGVALKLKVTPPASKRNLTISAIKGRVRQNLKPGTLKALARDMKEIRLKLESDLALITRMGKR